VALTIGRTDQGVDYSGRGPITALADGVVTLVRTGVAGWLGGSFLVYKYTSGPHAGRYEFVAEDFNPSVRVGQTVKAGQQLGVATGGSHGIERGWAAGATSLQAAAHAHYVEGIATAEGLDFRNFITGDHLGATTVNAASQFVDAVLRAIGAPLTATNRALLNAWMKTENTKARNNPLATTQSAPGATVLAGNTSGVKNYPTFAAGVAATAKTLQYSNYRGILASLRAGNVAPNAIVNRYALEFSTWGTNPQNLASNISHGGGSFLGGVWSGVSGIPGFINKVDPLNPYGALGAIGFGTGGLSSIQDFYNLAGNLLSRDFWLRMLEIGAGGVLALAGLWMLAKQIGLPAPSAGEVGLAVATRGAVK
jgi:hypothetical protein